MQTTAILVMTVDGRITVGDKTRTSEWASPEDARFFARMKRKFPVRIMGRKTFESVSGNFTPAGGVLRIVMTRHPGRYFRKQIPGSLEFVSDSPTQILKGLSARGFSRVLVTGGSTVFTAFLAERAIDELYLTIEPVIAGGGIPLTDGPLPDTFLRLKKIKRANRKGTLLLHYVRRT